MWGYFLALIMIASEISSSLSLPNGPHLSLIAMPVPSLMFLLATLLLISLILNSTHIKAPFRLGSTGKGEAEVRPAIFYVVEDVVAVEGNGGIAYRVAFNERYTSSKIFQSMIYNLSVVWMLVFYGSAASLTVLIWVLANRGTNAQLIALGAAWVVPFLIGGLLAWGTIIYVQICLRRERGEDGDESGERRTLLDNETR